MDENTNEPKWMSFIVWAALCIGVFFIAAVSATLPSDYEYHSYMAENLKFFGEGGLFRHPVDFLAVNFYPIYNILTRIVSDVSGCKTRMATCFVAGCCAAGTFLSAAVCFRRLHRGASADFLRTACVILMLVTPIYLPFFNPKLILGQASPNIWHNPTHLMVLVISFPVFVLYATIMGKIGKEPDFSLSAPKIAFLSFFIVLTEFAKPSFFQIFFPSLILLSLIKLAKYKATVIRPLVGALLPLVPAVAIVVAQFMLAFYSNHADACGIEIAFLKLWSHFSPNVFVSLFLTLLFPAVMLFWSIRMRRFSEFDAFAWIMVGVALFYTMFLIEKGPRMMHGNLSWGLHLALFFLWFATLHKFMSLTKELETSKTEGRNPFRRNYWFYAAVASLSLHLVSGVCYVWRLFILRCWQ